jgi:hypothetical protein
MRRITAGLTVAAVLALWGCIPRSVHQPDRTPVGPDARLPPPPQPAQLVAYLNDNARKVQGLQAGVEMDCKQGRQSVSLAGNLACARPRYFRLKAKALGSPAADIGSNDNEFWYWIKGSGGRGQPDYVYHCSYDAMARSNVNLPFPFQPDVILAALGMAEFDPAKQYRLNPSDKYLELVEETVSPQGQPLQKVTVFNRMEAHPEKGQPQVVAHILKDRQGKVVCQAVIRKVSIDPHSGAILPQQVTLTWPAQQIQMDMHFGGVQTAGFDAQRAERLFQRTDMSQASYDLGSGVTDRPGLQRTGLR